MINQHKHTDVKRGYLRMLRNGALLTATGAIVVLLTAGTAAGQSAASDAGPATRPSSMVMDGVGPDGSIRLTAGKSSIINLRKMFSRVSIGNAEVADYNKVSASSLLVTAKKPGTTAMVIFDDDNHSVVVDVSVDPDLSMLSHQIKQAFPALDISVTPLNDSIAIRGQVPTAQMAEQIVEMASTFGKVHNFLEMAGGQQVMLQVRFAEVSKSAMRSLGVTFGGTDGVTSIATNSLNNASLAFTGASPALGVANAGSAGGVTVFGQGRFGVAAFDYFVSAMRTNGLVRTLAEPNEVVMSGTTASFLAGGQVPIPVPQPGNGGSTITIEYHDYGVRSELYAAGAG